MQRSGRRSTLFIARDLDSAFQMRTAQYAIPREHQVHRRRRSVNLAAFLVIRIDRHTALQVTVNRPAAFVEIERTRGRSETSARRRLKDHPPIRLQALRRAVISEVDSRPLRTRHIGAIVHQCGLQFAHLVVSLENRMLRQHIHQVGATLDIQLHGVVEHQEPVVRVITRALRAAAALVPS